MKQLKSVDIVIPVYNEENELKENTLKLYNFLNKKADFDWQITIADNASMDRTPIIGKELAKKNKEIIYIRVEQKGRGRAIKRVWSTSETDILAYMDIDLSTDLIHLPNLVAALRKGYDIAIGSRLLRRSRVENRSLKREFISRSYNFLVKLLFQTKFSDAQCGFKAITRETAKKLLPFIYDNEWFMDSELLIIAEKAGLRIHEEPVKWVDNPGSTVRVLPTALGDLKGLIRLFVRRPWKMVKSEHG